MAAASSLRPVSASPRNLQVSSEAQRGSAEKPFQPSEGRLGPKCGNPRLDFVPILTLVVKVQLVDEVFFWEALNQIMKSFPSFVVLEDLKDDFAIVGAVKMLAILNDKALAEGAHGALELVERALPRG